MSRPTLVTYLIGNPLSLIGSWIAVSYTVYHCAAGDGSYPLAIFLVMVAASVFRASNRIARYNRWQREWNSMGPTAPRNGWRLPGIGFFFPVLGLLAMLWRRRPAKRDLPVKIHGARRLFSPSLQDAYTALPEHCLQVLQVKGDAGVEA